VCTLAHVFEAAGIATVVLASVRSVAERIHPPRALYCEFPLGRPLGRPQDPEFQRDVLGRAFELLDEPAGPVLVDHPEVIEETSEAMSCAIPAAFDPSVSAAVSEARGLRKAYDRATANAGTTSVGRVVDADGIGAALEILQQLADGEHWRDVAIPGKSTTATVHDIRTYYEEAALELVEGPPPGGRAAEEWFYEHTEAGRTVMAARAAIKESDAPLGVWYYMAPGHR
jgi:hypothetical protein